MSYVSVASFPDVRDLLLLDHVALPQDLHGVHVTRVKLLHQTNLQNGVIICLKMCLKALYRGGVKSGPQVW